MQVITLCLHGKALIEIWSRQIRIILVRKLQFYVCFLQVITLFLHGKAFGTYWKHIVYFKMQLKKIEFSKQNALIYFMLSFILKKKKTKINERAVKKKRKKKIQRMFDEITLNFSGFFSLQFIYWERNCFQSFWFFLVFYSLGRF